MRIVQTTKFFVIDCSYSSTLNDGDATRKSGVSKEQRNEGGKERATNAYHESLPQALDSTTTQRRMGIFLDIDEPYTRDLIQKAFRHPTRAPYFHITLGPGVGFEPVPLPPHCQFQWSEYERIDWHNGVLPGRHGASSYCIRKGLSRKAQLAHYTHRHVCKYPNSILREAIPQTVVLDCWSVWDDDIGGTPKMNHQSGLADVVVSIGSMAHSGDGSAVNRRVKLDTCLSEAKLMMNSAESTYQSRLAANNEGDEPAPVWILKGSTTNKGAGIYIVHLYEQVVDHCWSEPSIREWYVCIRNVLIQLSNDYRYRINELTVSQFVFDRVLQRYVANPLLLRKRKFHIRAYVLAVGALRVYFYRNCLALCAGKKYSNDNHYTNLSAHITNTAFQIETDINFQEKLNVLQWNEEVIAPILMRDGTFDTEKLAADAIRATISKMESITGELFSAYKGEFGVFAPINGCFEQYGLDFLVDDQWNVFLLEVNPGPDFKQTGNKLESLIENLMGCTVDVALLPDIAPRRHKDEYVSDQLTLVYEHHRPTSFNG
jgi:tubulin---tyrosine ligase